jgi:DNA-binding MarR family transcriptional regulator
MAKPTQDEIARLSAAFEGFTRNFKVAEAEAAADNALNAIDQAALIFVADNPGCALGDVARFLNVAMTTMSSAADRLVKKGLIERDRLEENRRSVALVATLVGRTIADRHAEVYRDLCRLMLSRLDDGERSEWIRLAKKIANPEP